MKQHQLFAVQPEGPQPLPWPVGAASVHEVFDDLPLGVYSALRTFEHNKFLWLDHHLDRTEQSMRLLGWEYRLDRVALCRSLHETCSAYPGEDARVRFDVLAGPATALGTESRVLIALTPFTPVPKAYREQGVAVELAPGLRRENPVVKTAAFVVQRRPYPLGHQRAYEHLIVDETGAILECSSANFYAVRDGVLWTAGVGMLEGITRKIILQLADELAVPVRLDPPHLRDVPVLEEAFLSSSSRGLVPVVGIADRELGDGRPGPITRRLQEAYDAFVAETCRSALDFI
jgi:branched-subunit amino acid aminotransferase/4-amino-4-deoxychorismate lyase